LEEGICLGVFTLVLFSYLALEVNITFSLTLCLAFGDNEEYFLSFVWCGV